MRGTSPGFSLATGLCEPLLDLLLLRLLRHLQAFRKFTQKGLLFQSSWKEQQNLQNLHLVPAEDVKTLMSRIQDQLNKERGLGLIRRSSAELDG